MTGEQHGGRRFARPFEHLIADARLFPARKLVDDGLHWSAFDVYPWLFGGIEAPSRSPSRPPHRRERLRPHLAVDESPSRRDGENAVTGLS
jgi:hypothetical protein